MKKLVVFAGPPCTGKSTVGRELGWAHIEMDDARATLLPEAAHTRGDRMVAYRAVLWAAGHLLRFTDIVICDGGFGHAVDREGCERVAREAGAELYVVEFFAPADVLVARNRARRDTHPGLDLTDERVREITEGYRRWGAGIAADATRPVEECAARVREYVSAPRQPGSEQKL